MTLVMTKIWRIIGYFSQHTQLNTNNMPLSKNMPSSKNTNNCLYHWQTGLSDQSSTKSGQPPNKMGIFLPSIDDLTDIVAIYNMAVPSKSITADLTPIRTNMRTAWFHEHLHNPKRPIYVLKQLDNGVDGGKGRLVGWGSFSDLYARPAYHISSEISLYLHPDYQQNGIGRTLLTWMLQQASGLGIKNVVALIFAHNQPSLALFKRLEFVQWGYMPQVCDMDGFLADVVMLAKQTQT